MLSFIYTKMLLLFTKRSELTIILLFSVIYLFYYNNAFLAFSECCRWREDCCLLHSSWESICVFIGFLCQNTQTIRSINNLILILFIYILWLDDWIDVLGTRWLSFHCYLFLRLLVLFTLVVFGSSNFHSFHCQGK